MSNSQTAKKCKKTSIGGQALIEGIMMRGTKKVAMAVRHTSGEIRIKEWDTDPSKVPAFFKLPVIRGIYSFIVSMKTGYKCLMDSAEMSGLEDEVNEEVNNAAEPSKSGSESAPSDNALPNENEKFTHQGSSHKSDKKSGAFMNALMAVAAVLGVGIAIVLFMYLPSKIFSLLTLAFPSLETRLFRSLFEGILRIVIFILYMASMTLMKDIKRTFMYHGAEHKCIFCYENGLELTVENVKKMKRFHPRCGTSFMILMLIVGIFISMFIPVNIPPIIRTVIKLCLLPITVGVGYELIRLAGRCDNIFTRIISKPGIWLQHISVLEPDDGMIECAIKALTLVIPGDDSDNW